MPIVRHFPHPWRRRARVPAASSAPSVPSAPSVSVSRAPLAPRQRRAAVARPSRLPLVRAALALAPLLALAMLAFPPAGLAAERTVRIADGTLTPKTLTIAPGTTVTWVNEEGNRHRVRSTSGPDEFDSGDIEPGDTFSFTFRAEGTYAYRDERARDDTAYQGTVVVDDAATPTPAPTAPPGPGATPAPGTTPAPPAPAPTVHMAGRVFRPASVTIDVGQAVVFLNDDTRDHTATARDGSFDTGTLAPGARATRTFRTPGTFAYFCVIHPDMVGTVSVRGAGGATPPPPPPATPTPRPTQVPPPPAGGVAVIDFAYRPTSLTVTAGATVTWQNQSAAPHTVTAADGSFDSGIFGSGRSYTRTFPEPGTFPYRCTLHPEMTATLVVAPRGGGPVPTPRPTPKPTPKPSAPPATSTTLDAGDLFFRPGTVTVPAGTTLTWRNVGAAPHTVTADDRSFDSGIFAAGATWSHTFSTAGTFPYFCAVHPAMTGAVVVTAAASGPGSSAPPVGAGSPPVGASSPPVAGVGTDHGAGTGGGTASAGGGGAGGGAGTSGGSGGAVPGILPGGDPASAPAPATTSGTSLDPVRLALVTVLVLVSMAAFGAVVRGLALRR